MGKLASRSRRILVLKFGALGDVVQAFAAFRQIRLAHPLDKITLLTTPPFAEFTRASGLFDAVEVDGRPRGLREHLALFERLRRAGFSRVYDLQTSGRSKLYYYGFLPKLPEWSGISWGASHRQIRSDRKSLHNLDRIADQLHVAGIASACEIGAAPRPDLNWAIKLAKGHLATTAERVGLSPPFALLIAGASKVKPEKFWPADHYADLAVELAERGLQVAIVGDRQERPLAAAICAVARKAVDLTGRTTLVDLAGLASEAVLCVGNDTGPAHLAAYAGAPGLMLMSRVSDPAHCGPRAVMKTLKVDDLSSLSVEKVMEALGDLVPALPSDRVLSGRKDALVDSEKAVG